MATGSPISSGARWDSPALALPRREPGELKARPSDEATVGLWGPRPRCI